MGDPSKEELLFAKIAIHNKIIDQAALDAAVKARRRRADVNQDLGRILKAQGAVDDKQYRSIRRAQEKALLGKGFSAEEAKFLARGMNKDGSAPDDEATATAPARKPAPQPSAVADLDPRELMGGEDLDDDEVEEVEEFEEVEEQDPGAESVPARAKGPRTVYKRPQDPKALKTMVQLLKKARDSGASDLHMSCGAKPFFRLHGGIHFLGLPEITPKMGDAYAAALMTDKNWQEFKETNDWDGSVQHPQTGRYRANVLKNRNGTSAVYRVIKTEIPTLDKLGLPDTLERLTTFPQGLVLVTGATGSGKSSTLAALIDMVNENRKDHIITMEDPVEYVFKGKNCNVTQREIHKHTKSWGNALRAALREDPDVIMVGEMRDLDTVQLAITAAETGHLVFGTLHTTSATRTIDRLLDVFPPGEQSQIRAMVSESLKGVVSQQLLPTVDGKGRAAAIEILFWTPAVANLIREGTTYKLLSVLQTGKKLGMQMMDDSIKQLLEAGKVTLEVARANAHNPKLFQ